MRGSLAVLIALPLLADGLVLSNQGVVYDFNDFPTGGHGKLLNRTRDFKLYATGDTTDPNLKNIVVTFDGIGRSLSDIITANTNKQTGLQMPLPIPIKNAETLRIINNNPGGTKTYYYIFLTFAAQTPTVYEATYATGVISADQAVTLLTWKDCLTLSDFTIDGDSDKAEIRVHATTPDGLGNNDMLEGESAVFTGSGGKEKLSLSKVKILGPVATVSSKGNKFSFKADVKEGYSSSFTPGGMLAIASPGFSGYELPQPQRYGRRDSNIEAGFTSKDNAEMALAYGGERISKSTAGVKIIRSGQDDSDYPVSGISMFSSSTAFGTGMKLYWKEGNDGGKMATHADTKPWNAGATSFSLLAVTVSCLSLLFTSRL